MPFAKIKYIDEHDVLIDTVSYPKSKVKTLGSFTTIKYIDEHQVGLDAVSYPRSTVKSVGFSTPKISGIYPFRIRFENIGISIPPSQGIGVAVIGSTFIIL